MKNTSVTNIILVLLLIINISFIGCWWYGHWKSHRMMAHNHFAHESMGAKFLLKELNFDASQQSQLEALRSNHFQKMKMLETAVARNEKNMMNAIMGNQSDSVHAFLYADSAGILKALMQKELFRHFNDLKKMCNPEQSRKFDDIMKKITEEYPHHTMEMHHGSNEMRHDSM
jgi:periplasmic protein CpxP/Spy